MSPINSSTSAGPSPTRVAPARPIPTWDELREMTSVPDRRTVIRGVDWAFYVGLLDSIPDGVHLHVDFDGKDLEIMSPTSPLHDGVKTRLGRFVEVTTEELEISCTGLGEATWMRPEIARGLESDECYFFEARKLNAVAEAMTRRSKDVADYPNPDLAIEVDISRPKIDRPSIYAALGVAEVWRFDDEQSEIAIERLGDDGAYHRVEVSGFLPVRPEEVGRWVLEEVAPDGTAWARRLRAWVREELAPRRPR